MRNVVVLPHIGSATIETRQAMLNLRRRQPRRLPARRKCKHALTLA
jgi:lactate dehydrogenase-like 2-hydroxyacid dehydrogenase